MTFSWRARTSEGSSAASPLSLCPSQQDYFAFAFFARRAAARIRLRCLRASSASFANLRALSRAVLSSISFASTSAWALPSTLACSSSRRLSARAPWLAVNGVAPGPRHPPFQRVVGPVDLALIAGCILPIVSIAREVTVCPRADGLGQSRDQILQANSASSEWSTVAGIHGNRRQTNRLAKFDRDQALRLVFVPVTVIAASSQPWHNSAVFRCATSELSSPATAARK